MKAQRGRRGIVLLFLLSRRWMGWTVNAMYRLLYPRERDPTHCAGGWMGPRTDLNGWGNLAYHRDSIPGPSSP